MGVLESPGKVLDFFASERVGTLLFVLLVMRVLCRRLLPGADPGGRVQGVRTPALLIRVPFFEKNIFSKHVVS